MTVAKIPPMMTCRNCDGFGVVHCVTIAEVLPCGECDGCGVVEARDELGRFVPWLPIAIPEEAGS